MANAILNVMRLNAARLNTYQPHVYLTIGGTRRETVTLLGLCRITKGRGPDGSHASLRVKTITPTVGQTVVIGIGSLNNRIFGGVIQAVQQPKNETVSTVLTDLTCVGYRWLLDRRTVVKTYVGQTIDAIVKDLIALSATSLTTANVAFGMATVGTVKFDGETIGEAIDQLKHSATDFDWYVDDYGDVHAFTGTESLVAPVTVTQANSDRDYGFFKNVDLSQVRTRVYVTGKPTGTVGTAAAGDVTLALQDVSTFGSGAGLARAAGQLLSYTGVSAGSTSPIVAPAAPTAAAAYFNGANAVAINNCADDGAGTVTVTTLAAHGLAIGDGFLVQGNGTSANGPHAVATSADSTHVTFTRPVDGANTANNGSLRRCAIATAMQARGGICTVTTAAAHGFSVGTTVCILWATPASFNGFWTVTGVPSTTTFTVSMSGHPADAGATASTGYGPGAAVLAATGGSLVGTYAYKTTFASNAAETLASSPSNSVTVAAVTAPDASTSVYTGGSGGSMTSNVNYKYGFTAVTAGGETDVGTTKTSTMGVGQTKFTIAIPAAVFDDTRIASINIYRTVSGAGGALLYVGSVAVELGGLSTSFVDTLADASLGGAAPATNPTGGAIGLTGITTSTDARIGLRRIYRTASGGSTYKYIAAVNDNSTGSTADAAADSGLGQIEPGAATSFAVPGSLTGIPTSGTGAILYPLADGDPIVAVAQRDSVSAQTALAAIEGGDGIHEHWLDLPGLPLYSDLQAAGDVDLDKYGAGLTDLKFGSRDDHFVPGVVAPVSMPAPNAASGSFLVQEVVIQSLELTMAARPLREITAADVRFTLVDVLRRVPVGA